MSCQIGYVSILELDGTFIQRVVVPIEDGMIRVDKALAKILRFTTTVYYDECLLGEK
jgi:hypothetical protein